MSKACRVVASSLCSSRNRGLFLVAFLILLLTPIACVAQVGPQVSVQVTPAYNNVCQNIPDFYTATYTTNVSAGEVQYAWYVDNQPVSLQQAPGVVQNILPYAFSTTGTHTVSCTVSVATGSGTVSGSGSYLVHVIICIGCNYAYQLSVHSNINPANVFETIQFSALLIGCPSCNNGLTSFVWNFGDGTANGYGPVVTHFYRNSGSYNVICTVTGNCGGSASLIETINGGGGGGGGGGGNGGGGGGVKSLSPGDPPGDNRPALCVAGGSTSVGLDAYTGNLMAVTTDPVATRSYPLVNNITLNTQSPDASRPMANAAFTYDIHAGTYPVSSYNPATQQCTSSTHWMVVDADGTRLDFGPTSAGTPSPAPGIFSQLSVNGSSYMLAGAGPPGDLKSAGDFTYAFNSLGLTTITDPAGNTKSLYYNSSNQLYKVTDLATGRSVQFQYPTNGSRISSVTQNDVNGTVQETTNLTYQTVSSTPLLSGISIVDPSNGVLTTVSYEYYIDGTLYSIVRDGDFTSTIALDYFIYSSCDAPVPMAMASWQNGSTQIDWSQPPVLNAAESIYDTNAEGGVTRYVFDSNGNMIRAVLPPPNGTTQSPVYNYSYNPNLQVTSVSDGLSGNTYTYNAVGELKTATDGLSDQWTWNYGGKSGTDLADLSSYVDPVEYSLGKSETIGYGDTSHSFIPTSYTDALNNIWSVVLNNYGQVKTITPPTPPLSQTQITYYDDHSNQNTFGYPKQVTDGNGNYVTFDNYDGLGDLTQFSTYPNSNTTLTTQITYDAMQRPTVLTHPDGKNGKWFYNGRNLDHTIDEAGTQYNYTFCSPCGALTDIVGPSPGTGFSDWSLHWTYNSDHQLTNFMDARGKGTQYVYGAAGELDSVTYPDRDSSGNYSDVEKYFYNQYGLLNQVENARLQYVTIGYDGAERPYQVTYPNSDNSHSTTNTYQYYPDDTLYTVTDGVGATTFTYDADGRVQSVQFDYSRSGLANLQELDYTYYPDGSRHTLTWKSYNGTTWTTVGMWTYGYDAGGRLTSVQNSWDGTTSWTYDGEDKLLTQSNPNHTNLTVSYNALSGWPQSLVYTQGTGSNPPVLASYALSYDGGPNPTYGHLTGVTETGLTQQSGSTVGYQYDALYRLTQESRTTNNTTVSHTYAYDLAGNRTSVDGVTYAANDVNEYTTAAGSSGISYDADGNLKEYKVDPNNPYSTDYQFAWDGLGQLQTYTIDGIVYQLGYDGFGHWITTTLPSQSIAPSRYYIYDGDLLLGELNPDGTLFKAYTWGANGPVSEYIPGGSPSSEWFVYDAQGATRATVDGNGNYLAYAYTAYGQTTYAGGGTPSFAYGGQYGYFSPYDTGVFPIRCGARWYFPQLGCWLTRDPIGYSGGANLYEYCGSDPIDYMDPWGVDRDHGVLRYVFSWDYLTDLKDEAVGAVKTIGNAVAGSMVEKVRFDAGGFHSEPWQPFHVGNSQMEQAGSVIADTSLFAFSILAPFAEVPPVVPCGNGGPCFVAGTLVAMADGTSKPIQTIQAGDPVSTRDPLTGRTEAKTVVRTFRHTVYETVTVQLADAGGHIVETLTGTPNHPFFVAGRGWVPMGSLGIGTQVVTRAGPSLFVASVTRRNHPQGVTVYNFEVQDDHTYFIGRANGGVWVHNDCFKLLNPKNWVGRRQAIQGIRRPGSFDVLVNNEAEARSLLKEAFPKLPQMKTYGDFPRSGGFQLHPAEPGVNELPHLKYSIGKGSNRTWGHIFFSPK